MVIGIVGGGASGMAAALAASENINNEIILFERQARVGRKLLATGNGRCNLTNVNASVSTYHGEDPGFTAAALGHMDPVRTLQWFRQLGLYTVTEASGKVYPYSDQANSVVDILRLNLNRSNIQLLTGFDVQKIKKENEGFYISNGEQTVHCDRVIVACGGLAGSRLGGSMAGYKLLSKFGHRSTRLRPALVQLKSSWSALPGLKGIRATCKAQVLYNGRQMAEKCGELQFTEYGLSGPVIFELSRDVCAQKGEWSCKLDFLPEWTDQMLFDTLLERTKGPLPVQELLTGILHNRLGRVLCQTAGIGVNGLCSALNEYDLKAVCRTVKALEVTLTEPMGMDHAQVTAGGVYTDQFDPETMESELVRGLYACGEVLDIDGDCGGYNLQWAWSSGCLAGFSAGREEQ